jgi:hypothetical protein
MLVVVSLAGVLALFPALQAGQLLKEARSSLLMARGALLRGSTEEAERGFEQARTKLDQAKDEVTNPFLRFTGFLPVIGRSPDATTAVIESALDVTEAGVELTGGLEGLAGGPAALAPRNGRIPLRPLQQLAGPLRRADRLLDRAGARMAAAPQLWLVPQVAEGVAEFESLLDEAAHAVDAAAALTRALPTFLGDGGPRRYFVAAQNPAELRGTGGLIGSYSILTVHRGKLEFGDFRPVTELETVPPERIDPPNPDYAAVYDSFSARGYWSNINMTPDFPSAAVAIERLYEETEGVRLDGVIATDPFALAALLEVVGPVQVQQTGELLNAGNAVDYLTNQAYASLPSRDRKLVLGDAAEEVLGRFIGGAVGGKSASAPPVAPGEVGRQDGAGSAEGETRGTGGQAGGPRGPAIRSVAGISTFGRALVETAAAGHLLFHSTEARVQRAFDQAGISGRLPHSTGDFLAIVANAGSGTKLDYYLRRRVHYAVRLEDDGTGHGVATVALTNSAPTSGLPSYVIGPHPFTDLRPGENQLYTSAYCALSCTLEGFRVGGKRGGVAPHQELGHPLFQTVSQIPSRQTEELAFSWTVSRAWDEEGGRGTYRLVVLGQPGIRPMRLSLSVELPEGMHVTATSPGMEVNARRVVWEGAAQDRMVFEVSFERSFLGRLWRSLVDFLSQPVVTLD